MVINVPASVMVRWRKAPLSLEAACGDASMRPVLGVVTQIELFGYTFQVLEVVNSQTCTAIDIHNGDIVTLFFEG